MVGFITDATKNKASFIAYNNNTLLQQKNFMSTKRTISEHINQKKNKYNKCLYYTLQWIPFSTSLRSTVCTPIVPFHFQICFAEGYALQPGTPKHPVPLENTLRKSGKFSLCFIHFWSFDVFRVSVHALQNVLCLERRLS